MKPLLFLDVDGVLNALDPQACDWGDDWRTYVAHDDLRSYRMRFSRRMLDRIAALDVEIVWCTTWRNLANTELSPLIGWPGDFPVIGSFTDRRSHMDWKYAGVREYLLDHPRRPFIWVDDDVCVQERVLNWASSWDGPSLLIAPDTGLGLSERHVEMIERFVNQHG